MSVKEKKKLKVDNTPAPLQSLHEIYYKVGVPFTAMKVTGAYAGTCFSFIKYVEIGAKAGPCVKCGGNVVCKDKLILLASVTTIRCSDCSSDVATLNSLWCIGMKRWILLS